MKKLNTMARKKPSVERSGQARNKMGNTNGNFLRPQLLLNKVKRAKDIVEIIIPKVI